MASLRGTTLLDLNELGSSTPALTDALGRVHAESAAVCLSDRGHTAHVPLLVKKIDDPEFLFGLARRHRSD